MSDTGKPFGVGIHELLRYAIPGYSFLALLFLPFLISGRLTEVLPNWQEFVPVLLVGGLLIGYVLYYPYYRFFYHFYYNFATRKIEQPSMQTAEKLCNEIGLKKEIQIIALHGRAVEKDSRIRDICVFQFSVFHSIGTMVLSMWLGFFGSFGITLRAGIAYMAGCEFWAVEGLIFLLLLVLSCILCKEYDYRRKLGFQLEDQIATLNIDSMIDEWQLEKRLRIRIDEFIKKKHLKSRSEVIKLALEELLRSS